MADDSDTGEAGQAAVVRYLTDPASHGGAEVVQVETHISRIFLAGDRAWKMKRAIRTNYLDFSTLAQRERICRREIEVNRAAAEIYLGVVPVVRRADGLALGGEGVPVEWLVEMRRFDRAGEMDRLCDTGALDRATIEALADAVAAMHEAAPRTPEFGDAADLAARIDQIAGALASAAKGTELAGAVAGWQAAAQRARQAQAALVARRHRAGRIRRCHGDLHLGNVVMIEGRPVPFDAIEFNESIASIDVLYDLALTLADLRMRGRDDLAALLADRYLGATRDYGGLALMPLFLSMRGAVRAMTAASRGDRDEAARDFDFARAALAPGPGRGPRLIAIGGLSGSGKSSVARKLAPELGAVVIRSDVLRKRAAGVAPEAHLPEGAYRPAMNRRVLMRMIHDARAALRAGAPVVLDATFLDPAWRDCAPRLAASEGVAFDGLWLDLAPEAAVRRVEGRGRDASDATAAVVRQQAGRASCPEGWHRIDAAGALEMVAERATAVL